MRLVADFSGEFVLCGGSAMCPLFELLGQTDLQHFTLFSLKTVSLLSLSGCHHSEIHALTMNPSYLYIAAENYQVTFGIPRSMLRTSYLNISVILLLFLFSFKQSYLVL